MDDYEKANTVMLMLIFWRAGPVLLKLNLTGLFILRVSCTAEAGRLPDMCLRLCMCVFSFLKLAGQLKQMYHDCLCLELFKLNVLNVLC